jgi:hypothetical protein
MTVHPDEKPIILASGKTVNMEYDGALSDLSDSKYVKGVAAC